MNWAVVKLIHVRFPHEHHAQLFVVDVPEDVTPEQIRSALTRAGHRFGEFGVPWANHYIAAEPDWEDEVVGAFRGGTVPRVAWEDLVPAEESKVSLKVRVPVELYERVSAAARGRGQTINAFVVSVLDAAVAEAENKGGDGNDC